MAHGGGGGGAPAAAAPPPPPIAACVAFNRRCISSHSFFCSLSRLNVFPRRAFSASAASFNRCKARSGPLRQSSRDWEDAVVCLVLSEDDRSTQASNVAGAGKIAKVLAKKMNDEYTSASPWWAPCRKRFWFGSPRN